MTREKGVATTSCPSCGAELVMESQPDGSQAAVTCSTCHPPVESEKAAETPGPDRERGVVVPPVEPAPDFTINDDSSEVAQ